MGWGGVGEVERWGREQTKLNHRDDEGYRFE